MSRAGRTPSVLRLGFMAGVAILGGAWTGDGSPGSENTNSSPSSPALKFAQAGSMMSGPKAAPPAAPAAPGGGSSMMSGPKPDAPATRPAPQPVAPPAAPVAPAARNTVPPTAPPAAAAGAAPPPAVAKAPPPPAAPAAPAPPKSAAIAAPVLGPFKLSQTATGYTAENLRFVRGAMEVRIPSVDITGSSLSQAELTSLLDPASEVAAVDRLQRLQAAEISIPVVASVKGTEAVTVRAVVLRNVAAGTIGTIEIGGSDLDGVSFAHMAASDLDIGLLVALSGAAPGASTSESKKIYAAFSIEGLVFAGPAPGSDVRIARIGGRNFAVRQTPGGWASDLALLGRGDPDTASPEERKRANIAMAEMFDAVSIGSIEVAGAESANPQQGFTGRLGRFALTGAGGQGGALQVDGIDVGTAEGRVRVASFTIDGVSLPSIAEAVRQSGDVSRNMDPANMRRFVPSVGTMRLSGFSFENVAGAAGAPLRVDIASMEARSDKIVNGVPSEMQFAVRNIAVAIPPDTKDETLQQVAGLGYGKLDASFASNLGWSEPTQEIALRELSFQSAGMGSIVIRGTVGNVTRDLFDPDSAISAVAAVGITAKALDITVRNDGLAERLLARQAKAQNRPVDEIRRDFGVGVAVMVPAALGDTPSTRALGQALGKFVAKPGTLQIQARAKQPGGFGFTDFAATPDPIAAFDKFDVTATAQ